VWKFLRRENSLACVVPAPWSKKVNKDLITEIQRLRNVKAKVIPVVTGATATISKSLRQFLSNILGKQEIKDLQKKQPYWALHTY